MRDAFGGLINIAIIIVFLVIVSGYMAYNVSYAKAFRVKNKVISTIEEFEGKCDFSNSSDTCVKIIDTYMAQIGYNPLGSDKLDANKPNFDAPSNCNEHNVHCQTGYCTMKCEFNKDHGGIGDRYYYYRVVTYVTLDIPVVNKIMSGMTVFQVTGDTMRIKKLSE